MNQGILDTAASFRADLTLLLEILIGVGLLAGSLLARRQHYRAHAWCQSSLVLLNLALIVLVMTPSFGSQVLPRLPSHLGKSFFALATAHAVLGIVVECLALYILVAAGTHWLPQQYRIQSFRIWMRTLLAGWWLVLFLGFATYLRWYLPQLFRR